MTTMTTRTIASSFTLCLLTMVVGAAQVRHLPAAAEGYGAFGFSNSNGTRLLVAPELSRPEMLHTALCSDGRRLPVQFEGWQAEREGHNGRQTPYNFDKLAGNVFRVLDGQLDIDASCFVGSDALLAKSTVLHVTSPNGSGACTAVERRRFASLRGRPVLHCWPIARLAAGRQIALLEFARRGKDALASFVLLDGNRMVFADYPAEFRAEGEDLWRADDGGVLSPEGFRVVCVLQRGESYVLGIGWAGPEGESLSLWVSGASERFSEVINDYWYQSPV